MSGENELFEALNSKNMHVRYWGTIAFNSINSKIGTKAKDALLKTLKDTSPSVRIEAANIFDLTQEQLSKKSRSIPDDFACRLTLSKAGKKKTLSFNELDVSEHLRQLSVHLRKLAIKKQSG